MEIIYGAVNLLLWFMEYAILARVIVSWLPISKDNQVIRFLYQITEPILAPIRDLINRSSVGRNMMLDFSPLLAFILIGFIRSIVQRYAGIF